MTLKIDSDVQREILSNARYWQDGARYSEIKVKDLENDLFNYHLQRLVKNAYLKKEHQKYFLTPKGKKLVTNIDEEDLMSPPNYKVSVYMCLVNNNQILLYTRHKHPQYGYTGLPSGKIRFGEKIEACAKRELFEETGLKAKFVVTGVLRQIRKNKARKIVEDGTFYVCYSDTFSGSLADTSREGDFFWVDINKVKGLKKLFRPSVEVIVKELELRKLNKIPWESKFIYEFEPKPEQY